MLSLAGILILGVGNCCLTIAELWVPSGLAALMLTVSPFWMVGIEALMPGGERLRGATLAGMLVGLAGSLLLLAPELTGAKTGAGLVKGFVLLQLGCASWSFGSIYQRRRSAPDHPLISSAIQQLAAGLAFLPAALIVPHPPIRWKLSGIAAMAYLVVFGSIVGYSAYLYALRHLPVALVSIYSYVNPVVAVALGWLFYREPFGLHEASAMAVIFAGVATVKVSSARQRSLSFAEKLGPERAAQRRKERETQESEQQGHAELHRVAQNLSHPRHHLRRQAGLLPQDTFQFCAAARQQGNADGHQHEAEDEGEQTRHPAQPDAGPERQRPTGATPIKINRERACGEQAQQRNPR